MRRQYVLVTTAMSLAVVTAFTIPLIYLLWTLDSERVISAATTRNQTILQFATVSTESALHKHITQEPSWDSTTVYLPSGTTLGNRVNDPLIETAKISGAQALPSSQKSDGVVVYASARTAQGWYFARTHVAAHELHPDGIRNILVIILLGGVLVAVCVMTADAATKPLSRRVEHAAEVANAIREGKLDVRLDETGPTEVRELAVSINRLSERISKLLSSERDAVADLSHRLRTPVTALRLDTDIVRDPEVADQLRAHVSQLERTVDAIVHDARRPTRSNTTEGVTDAARIVRERVDFWSALAEEQMRPLTATIPDHPLMAKITATELIDVLDVLLDNVFAHTPEGAPMQVWVTLRADGAIDITVEDGGNGLPQGDIVSRGSSGRGSTGLGLDIARRAALASGGWMELGQSSLGGAMVRVVLGSAG